MLALKTKPAALIAGGVLATPLIAAGGLLLTASPAGADTTLGCNGNLPGQTSLWGSVCLATSGAPPTWAPDGTTIHGLYSVITNDFGPAPSIVVRGCSQVTYIDGTKEKERCGTFTEVPNGGVLITGLYEHTDFKIGPDANGSLPWFIVGSVENAFGVPINDTYGPILIRLCGPACP